MAIEDWKTYRYPQIELKKDIRDEVHEFLTKVFNVYMVKLPSNIFKQLDIVRDKLINLTARFSNENYSELCDSFSRIHRMIVLDKEVPTDIKNTVKELADKANKFFASKGMPICIRELKYNVLRIKVLFNSLPLKDALVAVESEGKIIVSTKTDDNGLCLVEVPEGRYVVYVYKYVKEGEYVYEEKAVEIPIESELLFDIKETKTATEIAKERGGRPLIKEVS